MHHAIVVGHPHLVTWLLESGIDPSCVNFEGDTALKTAVHQHVDLRESSLPGLRALLEWRRARLASQAADSDLPSRRRLEGLLDTPGSQDGVTPLTLAVRNRFVEALHLLLANGASPTVRCRPDGTLPIYLAASSGFLPEMELLSAADPSPQHLDAPDAKGDMMTPLMMAAAGGHVDAVEWLLKQPGVSAEATTAPGSQNIYHVAATYGHAPLLALLLGSSDPSKPPAAPRRLAVAGDSDGDQAIHTAAHFGNLQCLKLLVEVLGNQAAFARNGAGHTPFELAVLQDMQQA